MQPGKADWRSTAAAGALLWVSLVLGACARQASPPTSTRDDPGKVTYARVELGLGHYQITANAAAITEESVLRPVLQQQAETLCARAGFAVSDVQIDVDRETAITIVREKTLKLQKTEALAVVRCRRPITLIDERVSVLPPHPGRWWWCSTRESSRCFPALNLCEKWIAERGSGEPSCTRWSQPACLVFRDTLDDGVRRICSRTTAACGDLQSIVAGDETLRVDLACFFAR